MVSKGVPPYIYNRQFSFLQSTGLIGDLDTASLSLTYSFARHPNTNFSSLYVRDDDVVDNEGMGRKSSKRCCIFHKQRAFGESSTDSSDYDSDQSGSSAAASGDDEGETGQPKKAKKRNRKIAHKKKIPDSQRFHA
jgi:Protein phosphatase inhibitor